MADTPQPQDTSSDKEPSIEEILGSIRQIISDETAKEDLDIPEEAEEEVLELTNKLEEEAEEEIAQEEAEEGVGETDWDAALAEAEGDEEPEEKSPGAPEKPEEPEKADEISPDDIDLAESPTDDPAEETTQDTQPEPTPPVDESPPESQEDDLLSADAAEQAASAIGKLSRHMPVERAPGQGVTIEDIVRQEIRPILRGWLDENLPDLVECLVREQLEKISRNAS